MEKVHRVPCGTQLPLPKLKDRYRKAEVTELTVIHSDGTVVVHQVIHSSNFRPKEMTLYRNFLQKNDYYNNDMIIELLYKFKVGSKEWLE